MSEPPDPRREPAPRFQGELVRAASGESYEWHSHDFGQLVSALSGSMVVGTPGRVLLLSPAMTLWIPPGVQHWMRYGSGNEMRYVDVPSRDSDRIGRECRVMAVTPLLTALMAAVVDKDAPARDAVHDEALCNLLLQELLAAPEIPLSLAMPQDERIRAAAEQALEAPEDVGSVETWLASVPASRKTIERLFISETGLTPSRWLRHARILHAISRLAAGEKIGAVALDMGYASASAFSAMFRRSTGRAPSDFRAA